MERVLNLLSCVVALAVISWSMCAIRLQVDQRIKYGCWGLLSITALRYIALMGYIMEMNEMWLMKLRPVYEVGLLTIGLLSAISMWYALPCLREQVRLSYYLGCFFPWYGLGLYGIAKQPTLLQAGSGWGYEVALQPSYTMDFMMLQGSFLGIICIIGMVGIVQYKHLQIRTQIGVIMMAHILCLVEKWGIGKAEYLMIRPFIIVEILMIWGAGYVLSRTVKSHKKSLLNR